MSQLPPPPGHPAQYPFPQPQPRPRGTRSRRGIWTAVVLLVLAPIVLVAGLWWSFSNLLEEDAVIPADGQPHQVSMPSGEKRGLYVVPSRPASCQATDAEGGTIELHTPGGVYSVNEWELSGTFDSGAGEATFTCTATDATTDPTAGAEVRIGSAPNFAVFMTAIFGSIGLAGLLGFSGLIVLILSLIRRQRR